MNSNRNASLGIDELCEADGRGTVSKRSLRPARRGIGENLAICWNIRLEFGATRKEAIMKYMLRLYLPDLMNSSGWVDEEFPAESDDEARALATKKREKRIREYGHPTQSALYKQIAYP